MKTISKSVFNIRGIPTTLRAAVAGTALMVSTPFLSGCIDDAVSFCAPKSHHKGKVQKKHENILEMVLSIAAILWLFKKMGESIEKIDHESLEHRRKMEECRKSIEDILSRTNYDIRNNDKK